MALRPLFQAIVILQLLGPFVAPAWATTFVKKTFERAVSDSESIIRGTIGMTYTNWAKVQEGTPRIFTFTELTLDEVLKGDLTVPGKTVILRELGGEKDGVGLQIPGAARFKRGEEVVVFISLPPNADGSFTLRGMEMGKYNLVPGDDGGTYLTGGRITQNQSIESEGQGDTGQANLSDPKPPKKWTLARLRELIKTQNPGKNQARTSRSPQPSPLGTHPAPGLQPPPQAVAVSPRPAAESGSAIREGLIWGVVGILAMALLIFFFIRK